MFIGQKEIKLVTPLDGEKMKDVKVEFTDDTSLEMRKECLEAISTEEPSEGELHDVIRFRFAKKFLTEMADCGLDYMQVEQIAQGISNLGRNLRDQACGMAFGVGSPLEIKVEDVFNMFLKDKPEEAEADKA